MNQKEEEKPIHASLLRLFQQIVVRDRSVSLVRRRKEEKEGPKAGN